MVFAFVFYLVQYFIIFFFNSALVGAAMIRLDGGDPTVRDGLRIAELAHRADIGYAAIAATVGLILRLIEERLGLIGRWIAGLLGIAFTIATFLTVPILVSRDVGPIEAVKESATLLKKTWGENIIGNAGMGVVFFLFYLGAIGIGLVFIFGAAQTGSAPLIVLVVRDRGARVHRACAACRQRCKACIQPRCIAMRPMATSASRSPARCWARRSDGSAERYAPGKPTSACALS